MGKTNNVKEQEVHSFGYVPSKRDIRDYKLNKKVCYGSELLEEFQVEHSRIKNQHQTGSCVAHATSEVLEQIEENRVTYSTAWIYGYRPFGYYQGTGMMPSDAMKTIRNVGCLQNSVLPGNKEIPEAKEVVEKDIDRYKEIASHDKVASYARLRSYEEIKEAIYKTKRPILICIRTKGLKLDKNYVAEIPPLNCSGGHAVVCYGWNELGLLIQNSWGTNWGDRGCFILPYEYGFTEAWLITKDHTVVVKPTAFALREFLVKAIRAITDFFVKIFTKK